MLSPLDCSIRRLFVRVLRTSSYVLSFDMADMIRLAISLLSSRGAILSDFSSSKSANALSTDVAPPFRVKCQPRQFLVAPVCRLAKSHRADGGTGAHALLLLVLGPPATASSPLPSSAARRSATRVFYFMVFLCCGVSVPVQAK